MDEQSIFLGALERETPQERAAWLDEACGDDEPQKQRILQLLQKHEQAGSFLEKPAPGLDETIGPAADDQRAAALDAGLAPAFSVNDAVVIGDANHSVLKMLGNTLAEVPHVYLRESKAEGADPIARPSSPEMPARDSQSRYRLDGEIARGGMGAIIKGRDTDLGRELAIKVLLDSHKDKPEVIQRFIEEAQIGGQMQHPGIAPIHELGQFADKRPFIAMKLVKGQTLSKLLSDREDAADERGKLIGIFEQICQTMAYAHSRGVIHRDLKPANIMVGAFGEVQVMDWGLAKVLQVGGVADEKKSQTVRRAICETCINSSQCVADEKKSQTLQHGESIIQTMRSGRGCDTPTFGSAGSQTQMGSIMGTPAYMPPEQALGEIDHLDERADVFGLGAILCEILTGQPPYVADDGTGVFRLASRGELDHTFARLDDCGADEDLIALTKHCLEREPVDRPRDAGVLAEQVTAYLESVESRLRETETDRAVQTERIEQQQRSARKLRKMLASLTVVATITVGTSLVAGKFWRDANFARSRAEESEATAQQNLIKAQIAQQEATEQRDAAQQAHLDAIDQSYLATLNEVRAIRLVRQSGWRAKALDRLQGLVQLGSRNVDRVDLRSEVLECLRGIDIRLESRVADGFDAWRMEYSPDGQTLAISSRNQVSLRDVATKREVRSIPKTFKLSPFSFHPSGSLAVASAPGRVSFHPLRMGQPSFPEIVGEGHALNLAFSGSGDRLAVVWGEVSEKKVDGFPNAIRRATVYETASGVALWNLDFSENMPLSYKTALALSPDGEVLATAGPGGQVRLFSVGLDDEPIVLGNLGNRDGEVCAIKFHPDGNRLVAIAHMAGAVWDLKNNMELFRLHARESGFWDVAFSPDGQLLAAVLNGNVVRFWHTRNGSEMASVATETNAGLSLAFAPNGDQFAAGGGRARIFQIEGRRTCQSDHSSHLRKFTFDKSRVRLLSINNDKYVRSWKLNESAPAIVRRMDRTTSWPRIMRVSPDDQHLAIGFGRYNNVASDDFSISIWTLGDLQSQRRLVGPREPVVDVAFGPAGHTIAAASSDGALYFWEFETGVLQNRFEWRCEAIQFLDETHLVVASGNRLILIASKDGEVVREASFPDAPTAFVLTPDRSEAIVLTRDGTIHRLRMSDMAIEQSRIVLDHPSRVLMAISPDGELLAVSTQPVPLNLWLDTKTLETLARLPTDDTGARSIEFDPDGQYFAMGSTYTDLWDLALVRGELMRLDLDFGEYRADEALELFVDAVYRAPNRGAKAGIIASAAALPGMLEQLSDHASDDGPFQAELAQHYLKLGEHSRADAASAKARELMKQQLAKEPLNAQLAIELADLLASGAPALMADRHRRLIRSESIDPWARLAAAFYAVGDQQAFDRVLAHHPTAEVGIAELLVDKFLVHSFSPLTPVEMKSEAGTNLTLRDDGSILASQEPKLCDSYTITTRPATSHIAGLCLEALPDPSIADEGPGWGGGNFHLTEIRAVLRRTGQEELPLQFVTATADHKRSLAEAAGPSDGPMAVIDGDQGTKWDIWPQKGCPHWLLLRLAEPIEVTGEDRIIVELDFRDSRWPKAKLGCFRLSAAPAQSSVIKLHLAGAVGKAHLSAVDALVAAYLVSGNIARAAELLGPTIESDDSPIRLLLRATMQRMRGDEEAARETAAVFVESLESETLPRLLHEPGFDLVHEFAGLDRQRFSSLLEQNDAALLIKRGEAYFATRQFDLARADWRRATELAPELAKTQFDRLRQAERCGEAAEFGRLLIEQKPEDTMLWVSVPPLAVLSEDDAAYPAVCRTILEIFRQRPTQKSFDRAIKSCLLKPGVLDMTELPIDWLTMSLDEATAPQWLPPWFWSTRALLAYRSGDAELAVKNVNQSEGHVPHDYCHALNMPVLAMAQHQLGRSEQARLALQEASRTIARIKEAPNSKGHHDLLIAEILFQEAEALMKEERPNESGNEKQ